MSKMTFSDKELCGLAVTPGISLKEGALDDERTSSEARAKRGFVPIEEISAEHVLRSRLSASQLRDCQDPLENLPRNMRLH